jgi:hypothetical protein
MSVGCTRVGVELVSLNFVKNGKQNIVYKDLVGTLQDLP